MFIAHGEKLRKHARWIMAGVLLLLIPGFVALFTTTGRSDRRGGDLPTIHGQPVNAGEFEQMQNLIQVQRVVLQNREFRRDRDSQDQLKREAMLQMLLDRQAAAMGLHVTDAELVQQIQHLPPLLNEVGQFEAFRYQQLLRNLSQRGVNEAAFEQVLRTQLLHAKLQQLVVAAAHVTPTEVQQAYMPVHEKVTIDLVRFDMANYQGALTVSNEEVRAFYEQNKESFRTPAQVKVRYATFPLADAEKSITLSDEEINDFYERNRFKYTDTNNAAKPLASVLPELKAELLKLRAERVAGDRATALTVKLGRPDTGKPDFAKLCADINVAVRETGYLNALDPVPGLDISREFLQKAFSLTLDAPYSDPIAGSNALYVLEFVDGKPSAIPTFEVVQEPVTTQVRQLRRYIATLEQAHATGEQLKKLVAGGKTFADACAELKLKIETPAAFTLADDKLDLPAAGYIQQAALALPVGGISELLKTSTGGVMFHLRDRQAADLAEFEKNKDRYAQQILQRNRQALFNDWLQTLIRNEQVDFKIKPRPVETEESASAN